MRTVLCKSSSDTSMAVTALAETEGGQRRALLSVLDELYVLQSYNTAS